MRRLSPRTFDEIALSLAPLADAPTWVKALWVEKELQARGLWQDDVFELVRPFLVTPEKKIDSGGAPDHPVPQPNPTASSSTGLAGEVRISRPLLTDAEAPWTPRFEESDGSGEAERAGKDPFAASETDDALRDTAPQANGASDSSADGQVGGRAGATGATEDESLVVGQSELTSALRLIAEKSGLSDDGAVGIGETVPADETASLAAKVHEAVSADAEPAEEPAEDVPMVLVSFEKGEDDTKPDLSIVKPAESLTGADRSADFNGIEAGVAIWSEARKPEPEIISEFESAVAEPPKIVELPLPVVAGESAELAALAETNELSDVSKERTATGTASEPTVAVKSVESPAVESLQHSSHSKSKGESTPVRIDEPSDAASAKIAGDESLASAPNSAAESAPPSRFTSISEFIRHASAANGTNGDTPDREQSEKTVDDGGEGESDQISKKSAQNDDVPAKKPAAKKVSISKARTLDRSKAASSKQSSKLPTATPSKSEKPIEESDKRQRSKATVKTKSKSTEPKSASGKKTKSAGRQSATKSESAHPKTTSSTDKKLESNGRTKPASGRSVTKNKPVRSKPVSHRTTKSVNRQPVAKSEPAAETKPPTKDEISARKQATSISKKAASPGPVQKPSAKAAKSVAKSPRKSAPFASDAPVSASTTTTAGASSDSPAVAKAPTSASDSVTKKSRKPAEAGSEEPATPPTFVKQVARKNASSKATDSVTRKSRKPAGTGRAKPVTAPTSAKQVAGKATSANASDSVTGKKRKSAVKTRAKSAAAPTFAKEVVRKMASAEKATRKPQVISAQATSPDRPVSRSAPVASSTQAKKSTSDSSTRRKPASKVVAKRAAARRGVPARAQTAVKLDRADSKSARKPAAEKSQQKSATSVREPVASKPHTIDSKPVRKTAAQKSPQKPTAADLKLATVARKLAAAAPKPDRNDSQPVRKTAAQKRQKSTAVRKPAAQQSAKGDSRSVRKPASDASMAAIADEFGLHITGSSPEDIAKLRFFSSVFKSQQGNWSDSQEQMRGVLDLLGDSPRARIWKRAIEQSLKIHDRVSRRAA